MDYRITGLLLAGSIPAALATIGLMHFTGVTKGWAHALTFSLGIALLLTAAFAVVPPESGEFPRLIRVEDHDFPGAVARSAWDQHGRLHEVSHTWFDASRARYTARWR